MESCARGRGGCVGAAGVLFLFILIPVVFALEEMFILIPPAH
jgi:hypothetical protein